MHSAESGSAPAAERAAAPSGRPTAASAHIELAAPATGRESATTAPRGLAAATSAAAVAVARSSRRLGRNGGG